MRTKRMMISLEDFNLVIPPIKMYIIIYLGEMAELEGERIDRFFRFFK